MNLYTLSDSAALRLGRQMATLLGFDADQLAREGYDLARYGRACYLAMNARPSPRSMPDPTGFAVLSPTTPTAGMGGAAVASPVPPRQARWVADRPSLLRRVLGLPVVRAWPLRILGGAGLLVGSGAVLGWSGVLAALAMGFGPLAWLLTRELA